MKKYLLLSLAIVSVLGFYGIADAEAVNLNGWAWSSNIGWISFNSFDTGTGDNGVGTSSVRYAVQVSTSTANPTIGSLSGYAWSNHLGWISFKASDVSGCSIEPCAPTMNMQTGAVTGYARLLSDRSWIRLSDTDKFKTYPLAAFCNPSSMLGTLINCHSGVSLDPIGKSIIGGFAFEPSVLGWIGFDALGPYGDGTPVHVCVEGVDPGCPPGGGGDDFSVTCSSSGGASGVNLTANISGGETGHTYTYQWIKDDVNIPNATGQSYSFIPPQGATSVEGYEVKVTDTSNNKEESSPLCTMSIGGSDDGGDGTISLKIGKDDGSNPSLSTLTISKNKKFKIAYDTSEYDSDDYECGQTITPQDSPPVAGWMSINWGMSSTPSDRLGVAELESGGTSGSYIFTLICNDNNPEASHLAPAKDSVTLKVNSSSMIEF